MFFLVLFKIYFYVYVCVVIWDERKMSYLLDVELQVVVNLGAGTLSQIFWMNKRHLSSALCVLISLIFSLDD